MHRKWWTLLVVSVATFMLLLDITVVNTALPAIEQDLGASFTELQWVIDAYALTLAAFVLTAGSLADRLGRRRVFTAGLVVFIVSSLAAGLAGDPTTLNVSRAVQGIGGAVMFAVSLALITQEFAAGRERGAAMGAYGATIGVAVAVGPLVGGAITEWVGWEWVFFLNVPIGLLALMITALQVRESRDPNATRIDWAGQAAFSGALLFLVLALLRGNSEGWGSTGIVAMFVAAGGLMAAFIAIERRVREPMLPLGLFRIRSFTGVQIAAFGVSGSLFALFLYLTLYLQNFLGLSPLEAGLRYLPLTLISFFTAAAAGAMLSRIQARYLLGAGLLGVGTIKDLALVLFVGLAVGAYSSLFLATPILCDLKERQPQYAALRRRVLAKRSAVCPGRVPLVRCGIADDGAHADEARAVVRDRCPGRSDQRGEIVTIADALGMPAIRPVTR